MTGWPTPVGAGQGGGAVGAADAAARTLLRRMFDAAVAAAAPAKVLAAHLPSRPNGRCVVIGAGKAAASMAAAVEACWPDVDLSGTVVAPYGYGVPLQRIRLREAAHPIPDENSLAAATEILAAVRGLGPDDLVLALISGGGSAAMCLPAEGLTLEDKQITNKLLLNSGLDIQTMNAVRRRISGIKGGRLAAAARPARVVTLAISDIPGDNAAAIASGPTIAPTDSIDLAAAAAALGQRLPGRVANLLAQPEQVVPPSCGEVALIATPAGSLEAAAKVARDGGVIPVMLGDAIEGESREVAREMALLAYARDEPTVLLSGGETTVAITEDNPGRGGRNTEFALAFGCAIEGRCDVWAIAGDTDGEDGANLGAAGAIVAPDTLERARTAGLDPSEFLGRHDSGSFFDRLGDLVITGPTRTNVNDFRAVLIGAPGTLQLSGD